MSVVFGPAMEFATEAVSARTGRIAGAQRLPVSRRILPIPPFSPSRWASAASRRCIRRAIGSRYLPSRMSSANSRTFDGSARPKTRLISTCGYFVLASSGSTEAYPNEPPFLISPGAVRQSRYPRCRLPHPAQEGSLSPDHRRLQQRPTRRAPRLHSTASFSPRGRWASSPSPTTSRARGIKGRCQGVVRGARDAARRPRRPAGRDRQPRHRARRARRGRGVRHLPRGHALARRPALPRSHRRRPARAHIAVMPLAPNFVSPICVPARLLWFVFPTAARLSAAGSSIFPSALPGRSA